MATTNDKVWQDWADAFLSKRRPPDAVLMSKEQTHAFASLCMLETSGSDTTQLEKDLSKDFLFQVLKSRADAYKLDYSIPLMVFIAILSAGRPGTAVMWVHALLRLQQTTKQKVTLTSLAVAYPVGFPTEATLQEMWDSQKGIGGAVDNYLDTVRLPA